MKLGETFNDGAAQFGRPLDGLRVLSLEQMQALPFATQLLARFGADIVKVEDPERGDSSRGSQPAIDDRGRPIGHTFMRYNLNKRSLAVDIRQPEGRDLLLDMVPAFDVVCENLGPGRAEKYGLGYEACAARDSRIIYLSLSGFGQRGTSPYRSWPAYAPVVEAICGMQDWLREPHRRPLTNPTMGLGDTATGMFGAIGILLALEHRRRMGEGQYIDLSMYDSMMAVNDVMLNFWSVGVRKDEHEQLANPVLLTTFACRDGWLLVFVAREHQFARLAEAVGHPELPADPRLATRRGWFDHTDDVIRPVVEGWTAGRTRQDAAAVLAAAGVPCAPCNKPEDVVADPHVAEHHMLVELDRPGGGDPVLVAGNPLKLSKVQEGPDRWFPALGEHTDEILAETSSIEPERASALRERGVIR